MIFDANPYRDDVNKISFVLNSYNDYLNAIKKFPNVKNSTKIVLIVFCSLKPCLTKLSLKFLL